MLNHLRCYKFKKASLPSAYVSEKNLINSTSKQFGFPYWWYLIGLIILVLYKIFQEQSTRNMAEQYNVSDEAIGAVVELGVVGTLVGAMPSLLPAMVTVATIGGAVASPIVVWLTGVAAVFAAYVRFSFGKRVVKGINHSLNNSPKSAYSPVTNNFRV